MKAVATLKGAPLSAQKGRLVANQIRNLAVGRAVDILRFSTTKASQLFKKLLDSAIANAENNVGADIDELVISRVFVDEGRTLKRIRPRAKGRANRILKRSCHITIELATNEE